MGWRLVGKPPPKRRLTGGCLRFSPMLRYLRKEVWSAEDVAGVRGLLARADGCEGWDDIDAELSSVLNPGHDPGWDVSLYERLDAWADEWERVKDRKPFPRPNRLTWGQVERLMMKMDRPSDLEVFLTDRVFVWDEREVVRIYRRVAAALAARVAELESLGSPPPVSQRKRHLAWRVVWIDGHPDVQALRKNLEFLTLQVPNVAWLAQNSRSQVG